MNYKVLIFLLTFLKHSLCSDRDSPLLEVAKLLMQGGSGKSGENDIAGLASSLIKGLDPSMLVGLLEQFGSNNANNNNEDGDSSPGLGAFDLISSLAPLLLQQQGHKHYDDPNLEDSQAHEQFDKITNLLPSILTHIWETFKTSGAWSELLDNSGLSKTYSIFTGPEGRLKLESAVQSLENPLFRKQWLKSMVTFTTEYVKQLADPITQKRYASNAASYINSFLRNQGYKPNELFIRGQPFEESLIRIIDLVCKRNFGIAIDSAKYIRPGAKYINDLIGSGPGGGVSKMSTRETEDKLADLINQEVLEGILRVWHAHKYTTHHHRCDKYVLCELNKPDVGNKYVVRPVVTKTASIVSAWFLSGQTGSSFLSLYDAIVEDYVCQNEFPFDDCMGFHEEDIRITTESAHNEL